MHYKISAYRLVWGEFNKSPSRVCRDASILRPHQPERPHSVRKFSRLDRCSLRWTPEPRGDENGVGLVNLLGCIATPWSSSADGCMYGFDFIQCLCPRGQPHSV